MVVEYTEFKHCFGGPSGFEELKKYMRIGNDFCKDLASVLTERADSELAYAKNLNKSSLRLQKLAKDFHGNLSDAWLQVSLQFDAEAEMHRSLGNTLHEEVVKPIKILVDNNNKSRKPIELKVDKAVRNYADKKAEDYKYRSRCFQLVKEIEKSMYSLDEAQKGVAGRPPNTKDIQKLECQIAKSREQLEKSESKFHKACSAFELARQDWKLETMDACSQMQLIELDRLSQLEQFIKKIAIQMGLMSKKRLKISDVYQSLDLNVQQDIGLACKKYGTGGNETDMHLYDIYAENTKNMMNKDRRIENLTKWADMFRTDVKAQLKSREGLEKVKLFSKENPNFNSNEADVDLKLESVRLLQILYQASLFKIEYALAELSDQAKPDSDLLSRMNTTYDRQAVPCTTLKLAEDNLSVNTLTVASAPSPTLSPGNVQTPIRMPMPCFDSNYTSGAESVVSTNLSSSSTLSSSSSSLTNNRHSCILTAPAQFDRPSHAYYTTNIGLKNADSLQLNTYDSINKIAENQYNNSNRSLSDDDDSDWDDEPAKTISKCMAKFDFKSTRDDEITIQAGDQIEILEKRDDGWWRGKLNDKIGLFPSTYVSQIT